MKMLSLSCWWRYRKKTYMKSLSLLWGAIKHHFFFILQTFHINTNDFSLQTFFSSHYFFPSLFFYFSVPFLISIFLTVHVRPPSSALPSQKLNLFIPLWISGNLELQTDLISLVSTETGLRGGIWTWYQLQQRMLGAEMFPWGIDWMTPFICGTSDGSELIFFFVFLTKLNTPTQNWKSLFCPFVASTAKHLTLVWRKLS